MNTHIHSTTSAHEVASFLVEAKCIQADSSVASALQRNIPTGIDEPDKAVSKDFSGACNKKSVILSALPAQSPRTKVSCNRSSCKEVLNNVHCVSIDPPTQSSSVIGGLLPTVSKSPTEALQKNLQQSPGFVDTTKSSSPRIHALNSNTVSYLAQQAREPKSPTDQELNGLIMFQSIQIAARRIAGVSNSLSDEDSSASDCEGKVTLTTSSGHETAASSNPFDSESQKCKEAEETGLLGTTTMSDNSDTKQKHEYHRRFANHLDSLSRNHLIGSIERTSDSLNALKNLLDEEVERTRILYDENQILEDTIERLVFCAKNSQLLSSHVKNQHIKKIKELAAKADKVSEAATAYAVPLIRTAFQNLVAQVPTALDTANTVLADTLNAAHKKREEPFLAKRRPSPRSNQTQCAQNAAEIVLEHTDCANPPPVANSDMNSNHHNDASRIWKSLPLRRLHAAPEVVVIEDKSKKSQPPLSKDEVDVVDQSVSTASHDKRDDECILGSNFNKSIINGMPETSSGDSLLNDQNNDSSVPAIMDITIIFDTETHSSLRSTFKVLATQSIDEAVELFGSHHAVDQKTKRSLVQFLEKVEEEAEMFPIRLEICLSMLMMNHAVKKEKFLKCEKKNTDFL